MTRTVKVRIVIAVDSDGDWYIVESDATASRATIGDVRALYNVATELALPEVVEVPAEVESAE